MSSADMEVEAPLEPQETVKEQDVAPPEGEKTAAAEEAQTEELSAPQGWKKKLVPKKGGTPKRTDVVFVSPTGEEIKTKRQLERYLKANPGGPSVSEFEWNTGGTPRRSERLSSRKHSIESPEPETTPKRGRKKGGKRESKDNAKATEGNDEEMQDAEKQEVAPVEDKAVENEETLGDKEEKIEADKEKTEETAETEENTADAAKPEEIPNASEAQQVEEEKSAPEKVTDSDPEVKAVESEEKSSHADINLEEPLGQAKGHEYSNNAVNHIGINIAQEARPAEVDVSG